MEGKRERDSEEDSVIGGGMSEDSFQMIFFCWFTY